MKHLFKILNGVIAACCIVCLLCPAKVYGQKKELSRTDTADINISARATLNSLKDLLNFMSSPDNGPSEIQQSLTRNFTPPYGIFTNDDFAIEDDTDPDMIAAGGGQKNIKDYLQELHSSYKATDGESIEFKLNRLSFIKYANKKTYIKAYYSEKFNGTNSGKKYPERNRVVEMQVYKQDNKWITLINNIYFFQITQTDETDKNNVTVVDDNSADHVVVVDRKHDDSYYRFMLQQGLDETSQGKYADAYANLREAAKLPELERESYNKLEVLYSKIMASGGTADYKTDLYRQLNKRAGELRIQHDYEGAERYYVCTLEIHPEDQQNLSVISDLKSKIENENQLQSLIERGAYDQAIAGYNNSIKNDDQNPDLYIGRAKCYGVINDTASAKADFQRATSLQLSNLDAYKSIGEFYKNLGATYEQSRSSPYFYTKAYDAYAAYDSYDPNKNDSKLKDIYNEMSFCKGMVSFVSKNYTTALDTFTSITHQNPAFGAAYLYQGRCYYEQHNTDKAIECVKPLVVYDPTYADGFYWLGYFYHSQPNDEAAIKNLKAAIRLNDKNAEWNMLLGRLLQENGAYADAILYYTNCITYKTLKSKEALWKRGECKYQLHNYVEAKNDYDACGINGNPAFNADCGFTYLAQHDLENANAFFSKAKTADGYLGLAVVAYIKKQNYEIYLTNAFDLGLDRKRLDDPNLAGLSDDREFKKLRKKHSL